MRFKRKPPLSWTPCIQLSSTKRSRGSCDPMTAAPSQSAPLTEKAAHADLVTWADKRPAWQKDALRCLVTGETLDDHAISELTELCLDPTRTHSPIAQS